MELEITVLSDVSQKDKHHVKTLVCGIYTATQMNLSTKQKQTHREQACGCQGGGGCGGKDWESGITRCKLLYVGWINYKVLLRSTGNYIQYPVINCNGKEYKKECV